MTFIGKNTNNEKNIPIPALNKKDEYFMLRTCVTIVCILYEKLCDMGIEELLKKIQGSTKKKIKNRTFVKEKRFDNNFKMYSKCSN